MKHLILAALLAVTVAGGAALAGTGATSGSGDELVASVQTIGAIADIENMLNLELVDAVALHKIPGFLEVTDGYVRVALACSDCHTGTHDPDLRHAFMSRSTDHAPYMDSATFAQLARSAPKLNTASDVSRRAIHSGWLLC